MARHFQSLIDGDKASKGEGETGDDVVHVDATNDVITKDGGDAAPPDRVEAKDTDDSEAKARVLAIGKMHNETDGTKLARDNKRLVGARRKLAKQKSTGNVKVDVVEIFPPIVEHTNQQQTNGLGTHRERANYTSAGNGWVDGDGETAGLDERRRRLEAGVELWGATFVPPIEPRQRQKLIDKWSGTATGKTAKVRVSTVQYVAHMRTVQRNDRGSTARLAAIIGEWVYKVALRWALRARSCCHFRVHFPTDHIENVSRSNTSRRG